MKRKIFLTNGGGNKAMALATAIMTAVPTMSNHAVQAENKVLFNASKTYEIDIKIY